MVVVPVPFNVIEDQYEWLSVPHPRCRIKLTLVIVAAKWNVVFASPNGVEPPDRIAWHRLRTVCHVSICGLSVPEPNNII
jgi:hypothetical protein